ncbi:hypothetical protein J2R87_006177 [Bradyrhizobium elkanii]|nr:hypothetical protein [Bradyrhizobium elkanii]MCS4106055.1 hypothetical protein [Bradyrhizobium elkanii]
MVHDRSRGRCRWRGAADEKPPSTNWLRNILQELRPQVLEGRVDLAANLPLRVIGDADPARFGNPLQARCDVDAIAKDIVVIKNDVADVDSDSEFEPLLRWYGSILIDHSTLNFYGAAHRIDGAGEFNEYSVAARFDDAAAMRSQRRIEQHPPDRLQPGQGAFLVDSHQPAVAGDIRRQNRCQTPIHGSQGLPPDDGLAFVADQSMADGLRARANVCEVCRRRESWPCRRRF